MLVADSKPIRILHLVDATVGWPQRYALSLLLQRAPAERFDQLIARLGGYTGIPHAGAAFFPWRGGHDIGVANRLRRWVMERRIDVVHAWGCPSLALAGTALHGALPLAVSVFDPLPGERATKLLRTVMPLGRTAVACSAAIVRRRLIEAGVSPEVCVVIRPGVDFAAINAAQRAAVAWRRSQAPGVRIVITDHADARHSGLETAVHAVAIRRYLEPGLRLVVPGLAHRGDRRLRWLMGSNHPDALIDLPGAPGFEVSLAYADVLLMPVTDDVDTTAIAWAMAASVPIIAGAVYATTELLAHKHNALLLKPESSTRMSVRLAAMLGEDTATSEMRDTARGQAFEVFGLRRFLDQQLRLYDNLTSGAAVSEGIADTAIVA